MRYKFEFFGKLLSELKIEIARTLPKNDLAKLVESSKIHLKLFKPLLDVQKLLHHTVRGEHDAVQSMLKKDINLFFMKGRVTDCSGRTLRTSVLLNIPYGPWISICGKRCCRVYPRLKKVKKY